MAEKVSNVELMKRCYAATHEAADEVSALWDVVAASGRIETPEFQAKLKKLRNLLRDGMNAAQTVRTRVKQRDAAPKQERNEHGK